MRSSPSLLSASTAGISIVRESMGLCFCSSLNDSIGCLNECSDTNTASRLYFVNCLHNFSACLRMEESGSRKLKFGCRWLSTRIMVVFVLIYYNIFIDNIQISSNLWNRYPHLRASVVKEPILPYTREKPTCKEPSSYRSFW